MPFKSEKINIANSEHDRRCKLTDVQKDQIIALRGTISQRKCAEKFGVSRRTVQFLWWPEKLQANKQRRQERGGWKQYYNKTNWARTMREHRRYKQDLHLEGLI